MSPSSEPPRSDEVTFNDGDGVVVIVVATAVAAAIVLLAPKVEVVVAAGMVAVPHLLLPPIADVRAGAGVTAFEKVGLDDKPIEAKMSSSGDGAGAAAADFFFGPVLIGFFFPKLVIGWGIPPNVGIVAGVNVDVDVGAGAVDIVVGKDGGGPGAGAEVNRVLLYDDGAGAGGCFFRDNDLPTLPPPTPLVVPLPRLRDMPGLAPCGFFINEGIGATAAMEVPPPDFLEVMGDGRIFGGEAVAFSCEGLRRLTLESSRLLEGAISTSPSILSSLPQPHSSSSSPTALFFSVFFFSGGR